MNTENWDASSEHKSHPLRPDATPQSNAAIGSLPPMRDDGPSASNQSEDSYLDVMSILMFKRSPVSVPMAASSSSVRREATNGMNSATAVPSKDVMAGSSQGDVDSARVSSSSPCGGRRRDRSVDSEEKTKDLCRVCSDVATGFHYGVVSCEGCKGFFKRSVQMNRKYRCRLISQCAVNRKTRNSCQSCRFAKCLAIGMSISLVRPDRTPGNRRKRPLSKKELANLASDSGHSSRPATGDFRHQNHINGNCNNSRQEEDSASVTMQKLEVDKDINPTDIDRQLSTNVDSIQLVSNVSNVSSAESRDNDNDQVSVSPVSDSQNCTSPLSGSVMDSPNSAGTNNQRYLVGMVVGSNSDPGVVNEERPVDAWNEPRMIDIIDNMNSHLVQAPPASQESLESPRANSDNGCRRPGVGFTLGVPPVMQMNTAVPDQFVFSQLSDAARQVVQIVQAAQPNIVPDYSNRLPTILTSQCFMNVAYEELETIVSYAKSQLGFRELFMSDRRQVLRNSFLAVQLVRLSYRSLSCNGKILFAEGLCLTPAEAIQVSKFPPIVISMNLELIEWFRSLQLNEIESGLVQTIILSSDDADGLTDRAAIRRMQNRHVETLREYSVCRFPHAPHRFASLLLRLPFVRKMALICLENFFLMIESGQLTMNQLTKELVQSS